MFFGSIFQFAPLCLQFLLAIIVLVFLIVKWPPSQFRSLMSAVLVICFLLPPAISLGLGLIFSYLSQVGSYNYGSTFELLGQFSQMMWFVQSLLPLVSLVILLIYILKRIESVSQKDNDLRVAVLGAKSGLVPARSWNTDVDSRFRINILRKREWAFLIDVLPVVTFNIVCFWLIARFSDGYSPGSLERILLPFVWMASFLLVVYVPFKDVCGGRSLGKMISKCRVVRTRDGTPIGIGESFVRNVLFLVPLMPIVELVVASFRPDRKRLGDLLAGTTVVAGEPEFVNGIENVVNESESEAEQFIKPHPLDD